MRADHGSAGSSIAIEARNLRKSFAIPLERHDTVKERMLRPRRWMAQSSRELTALRDVSFDVRRGEFFGVIGRNGCGKSTLLKLMASIYRLDSGSIRVAGRLAPFIELGVGFNPELSARENVVLNGVMMGLSPAEARSRFDAVIDYAELWDYTELKLKNYSSGMHVRLAFSLMLQVDADVLLVDEVLAVGDAAFQAKCEASLEELQARGTTIVLVTHDMDAIEKHCDRALLLEGGVVETIGDARGVAERYLEVLFAPEEELEVEEDPAATVTGVWIANAAGEPAESLPQGEPIVVNATVRANHDLPEDYDLRLFMELVSSPDGVRVAAFPVGNQGELTPLAAGEIATVSVSLEADSLRPANYRVSWALVTQEPEVRFHQRCAEPERLTIAGPPHKLGLIKLQHEIAVDRDVTERRR